MVCTKRFLATAAAFSFAAGAAQAQTTITGINGGNDSWNDASNWDNGVPTGVIDPMIADGVIAKVATTPSAYTGTLTIGVGSELEFNDASESLGQFNALGTGLIMKDGSEVDTRTAADPTFPAIELQGNVHFRSTANAADRDTKTFGGAITGTGDFLITGRNVEKWVFTQTNPFVGNITFDAIDRYIVRGNAQGAFGTGNVTTLARTNNPDMRSAILDINVDDVMADSAIVSLNGTGGNNTTGFDEFNSTLWLINMDANDTIAQLFVNGAEIPAGSYTGGDFDWIGGTGVLTVGGSTPALPGDTNGDNDVDDSDLGTSFANYTGPLSPASVPEPTSLALLGLGGLLVARRRR